MHFHVCVVDGVFEAVAGVVGAEDAAGEVHVQKVMDFMVRDESNPSSSVGRRIQIMLGYSSSRGISS